MKSLNKAIKTASLLILIIGCNSNRQYKGIYIRKCIGLDSCGYVDANGSFKIKPGEYMACYTDTFKNIAIVLKVYEGTMAIDKDDNKLFTVLNYDNGADELKEGLFRIIEHDKIGFVNMDGKLVITAVHKWVEPFSNGLAAYNDSCIMVKTEEHTAIKGGKWGYIDKSEKVVIPAKFDNAGPFTNGTATVAIKGKVFSINTKGDLVSH